MRTPKAGANKLTKEEKNDFSQLERLLFKAFMEVTLPVLMKKFGSAYTGKSEVAANNGSMEDKIAVRETMVKHLQKHIG